jgi:2-(1,2-epoxy-1,2-dihydrophenyl)acetyl-CoA isomerase
VIFKFIGDPSAQVAGLKAGDIDAIAFHGVVPDRRIKFAFSAPLTASGGAWFLPRLVGTAKALELFWTGELVDAHEAERIGIVNKVVPDAELMTATNLLAEKIAAAPPLSVRFIKRAVYQGQRTDLRSALDLISSHYAVVSTSADHREAVNAYLEKRKPKFTGR